jgi:deoxyxylulose-5-phosphate synthase
LILKIITKIKVLGIPDEFIEQGSVDELKSICNLDSINIQKFIEIHT